MAERLIPETKSGVQYIGLHISFTIPFSAQHPLQTILFNDRPLSPQQNGSRYLCTYLFNLVDLLRRHHGSHQASSRVPLIVRFPKHVYQVAAFASVALQPCVFAFYGHRHQWFSKEWSNHDKLANTRLSAAVILLIDISRPPIWGSVARNYELP